MTDPVAYVREYITLTLTLLTGLLLLALLAGNVFLAWHWLAEYRYRRQLRTDARPGAWMPLFAGVAPADLGLVEDAEVARLDALYESPAFGETA